MGEILAYGLWIGERKPRPRLKLLDLFCGAGGAAVGYYWAGFDPVGVDISPQPRYPFDFIQADALKILDLPWLDLSVFDLVHASPPCQRYSSLGYRNGNSNMHPDLIGKTRRLLKRIGKPYVIENIEGSPLRNPTVICGTALGLGINGYRLRRHRWFESNFKLRGSGCTCWDDDRLCIDVSGGGMVYAPRKDSGGSRSYKGNISEAAAAMGIDWMRKGELNEAIPPAYTELIVQDYLDLDAQA